MCKNPSTSGTQELGPDSEKNSCKRNNLIECISSMMQRMIESKAALPQPESASVVLVAALSFQPSVAGNALIEKKKLLI